MLRGRLFYDEQLALKRTRTSISAAHPRALTRTILIRIASPTIREDRRPPTHITSLLGAQDQRMAETQGHGYDLGFARDGDGFLAEGQAGEGVDEGGGGDLGVGEVEECAAIGAVVERAG